jgi:hypothetical protein
MFLMLLDALALALFMSLVKSALLTRRHNLQKNRSLTETTLQSHPTLQRYYLQTYRQALYGA